MATDKQKREIVLLIAPFIGVAILVCYLIFLYPDDAYVWTKLHLFDRWIFERIPIWAAFLVSATTCVLAISASFIPLRPTRFIVLWFALLGFFIISHAGLKKLPDPWDIYTELALIFCMGLAIVRARLGFSPIRIVSQQPANATGQKSIGTLQGQSTSGGP